MKTLTITGCAIVVIAAAGLFYTPSVQAQQAVTDPETQAKILKGYQIAPVPLNLVGRDATLVGLGSYLVNGVADCNGCHSAGPPTQYALGGNPYAGQSAKVNPATYLGGGNDFGAFPDPEGPFPHIISRNLTPDSTGLPEGGHTLQQFMQILRTGADLDHVHPTCTGKPDGKCIPPPFNGDLLQIMPWPVHTNMTDRDLQSIYEYLSAIPCVEGGPGEPANRCTPVVTTTAVAGPKNATVIARQIQLDGTKSVSSDGNPLSYNWTTAQGSPSAAILGGTTATPTVQFGPARGSYTFQLTVTDSKGKSATDSVSVNFQGI